MKTTSQLFKSIYLTLSALSLAAFSNIASAVPMFQPSNVVDTDLSQKYLNMIFGEVGPLKGAVKTTIIGDMMGVWCSGVLLVSCIATFCYIIQGTIQTAHEGEPLGQKWSSVWVPARLAISLAMIVPTAGGYCLIQSAIMWCALQGVNLADMVWNTAADSLYSRSGMLVDATPTAGYDVASKLLVQMACVEAVNREIDEYNQGAGYIVQNEISMVFTGVNQTGGFGWGHPEGVGPLSPRTCGGMSYVNASALHDGSGRVFTENEGQTYETMKLNAQKLAIEKMVVAMKQPVHDMVINGVTPSTQLFNSWADIYNQSINNSLKNSPLVKKYAGLSSTAGANDSMTSLRDLAKKDGWVAAGSYFASINSINAKIQDFANVRPNEVSTALNLSGVTDPISVNSAITTAGLVSRTAAEYNQTGMKESLNKSMGDTKTLGYAGYEASKTTMEVLRNGIDNVGDWSIHFFESFQIGLINVLTSSEPNPMLRMEMLGRWAMDAGEVYYAAKAAVLIFPEGKVANGISKATSMVKDNIGSSASADTLKAGGFDGFGFMDSLALGLVGIGILLSIIAPMLPFILFAFGIMSWIFAVVIAMTAGPVFAMGHASPEGHEMAGGAMNGYSLLLGVTLRPTLMLFGMFFAMLVMYVGDQVLQNGFSLAFESSQSDAFHGPIVTIVGLGMYGVLAFLMTHACFKLITKIPDSVLQWAGHANDNDALGVDEQTHSARGVIISGGRSLTSGVSQGFAQKGKHESDKVDKKDAENRKHSPKPQAPSNNNGD